MTAGAKRRLLLFGPVPSSSLRRASFRRHGRLRRVEPEPARCEAQAPATSSVRRTDGTAAMAVILGLPAGWDGYMIAAQALG